MKTALLLLGTNIGNRLNNINSAIELINISVGKVLKKSSIYETEPWGFSSDQFFFNMALTIETILSPYELIIKLGEIEKEIGRTRSNNISYENRIIDIDILSFDDEIISTSELEIPHPRLHLRRFTLLPIQEILP
ncbi:MAG: 2-amino-4-hydroxy-6-hydroxymethyldihydropteridine diphosphokinase, partial [Bacteroidia bacterium]|nr:2-amino-4-hydroxy-6-hydroxymethyldihydropteridine diphosphokinase [Bacteroidia bacterium]